MKVNYPATLRDARMSRQQMAEIDEQEGRERVPAAVLDSAIGLMAALRLLEDDNRLIEQTARKCPLRDVYGVIPGMEGSADTMGMCPYLGSGKE